MTLWTSRQWMAAERQTTVWSQTCTRGQFRVFNSPHAFWTGGEPGENQKRKGPRPFSLLLLGLNQFVWFYYDRFYFYWTSEYVYLPEALCCKWKSSTFALFQTVRSTEIDRLTWRLCLDVAAPPREPWPERWAPLCTPGRPAVSACPCLSLLPKPDVKVPVTKNLWPRRAANCHDRLTRANEQRGGVRIAALISTATVFTRWQTLVRRTSASAGGGERGRRLAPLTLHLSSFSFPQFRHSVNFPSNLKVFLFLFLEPSCFCASAHSPFKFKSSIFCSASSCCR